jgi:hypothetical protein
VTVSGAAADDFPERKRGLWAPVREFVYHYAPWVWVAAFVSNAINPFTYHTMLSGAARWLVIAGISLMFVSRARHHHHLCMRCMNGTPLDPEVEVNRHRRSLRTMHAMSGDPPFHVKGRAVNPWLIFVLVLLLIAVSLAGLYLGGTFYSWWALPLDASCALLVIASLHHEQLQPWCPWCYRRRKWEDEGIPEPSPDPDPVGERDKELT